MTVAHLYRGESFSEKADEVLGELTPHSALVSSHWARPNLAPMARRQTVKRNFMLESKYVVLLREVWFRFDDVRRCEGSD